MCIRASAGSGRPAGTRSAARYVRRAAPTAGSAPCVTCSALARRWRCWRRSRRRGWHTTGGCRLGRRCRAAGTSGRGGGGPTAVPAGSSAVRLGGADAAAQPGDGAGGGVQSFGDLADREPAGGKAADDFVAFGPGEGDTVTGHRPLDGDVVEVLHVLHVLHVLEVEAV